MLSDRKASNGNMQTFTESLMLFVLKSLFSCNVPSSLWVYKTWMILFLFFFFLVREAHWIWYYIPKESVVSLGIIQRIIQTHSCQDTWEQEGTAESVWEHVLH